MDALDYFAIQNLIYRYADLLDSGKPGEAGALFDHADFYLEGETAPLSRAGRNCMAQVFQQWMSMFPQAGGLPCVRHVTTNLIVEPDGVDRARTQACVTIFRSGGTLPVQAALGGDYSDRFQRVDGQWRFIERRLQPFGTN